nr:unnamed protein product [Salmo salar]|eukprot:XP_014030121.1 PREDICTED: FTS and Hook-interacting protein homolog [Salmo salar]
MSWLSRLTPRGPGGRSSRNVASSSPCTADPETCLMVFENHWRQLSWVLEQRDPSGSSDDLTAVRNHTDQMLCLLAEERPGEGGEGPPGTLTSGNVPPMGPILGLMVTENVLERVVQWHLRRGLDPDSQGALLKLFEMLIGQSQQPLLQHKAVLQPLLGLLGACAEPQLGCPPSLENSLVLLLNQICVSMARAPAVLELLFRSAPAQHGPTNLLIFSLLVPFIHRDGAIGQQARDALLLVMATSASNQGVARYIAENSYFCPVLATGLSALYSSLPRKIEVRGDDWHALRREDWMGVSSLVLFMNSLEFCNAVIQVAHPLVRSQLVDYVHNGFLVPVMGPALHKVGGRHSQDGGMEVKKVKRDLGEQRQHPAGVGDSSQNVAVGASPTPAPAQSCGPLQVLHTPCTNSSDVSLTPQVPGSVPPEAMLSTQSEAVERLISELLDGVGPGEGGQQGPGDSNGQVLPVFFFHVGSSLPLVCRCTLSHPFSRSLPLPSGPFMMVLFAKLENMLQNSLYVNILLTGILCQLACYPQPLLRSFLLNTNMVFQPSVKSLIQVLGSVKNRIEVFAASHEDFPAMLRKAQRYLVARGKVDWADSSPMGVPTLRRSDSLVKSRKPSLGDLIMRHTNSPTRARHAAQLALAHVRDGGQSLHSALFRGGTGGGASGLEKQVEALRVKNAVYCAVIFSEFLKELAALAQEHSVSMPFLQSHDTEE